MKRLLALLLLACLAISLFACGAKAETKFTFVVTHGDGTEKRFEIETDKKTLGDALLEEKLVVESKSGTGLYDTIDGEKADWDDGEAWWRFTCNGESLTLGITDTALTDGATYEAIFTRGFAD